MTELYGLKHHSPSALNLAAASLPLYFLEKVKGIRSPGSCAMFRGTSSETGIVHGLLHPSASLKECQDVALAQYDKLSALNGDPKRQKERDAIPGIVEQGIIALCPYGIPDEVQVKVLHELPGVKLPILGFCDLGWTYHGIRLDIKSQLSLSSEASEPHRRQVATYIHNTNAAGRLAYITPKKHGVYQIEDAASDMHALVTIAQRVERFLSLSNDPAELAALLIPDYSSFYWNDVGLRNAGRELFGF